MKFRSLIVPALFLSSLSLAPQAAHADIVTFYDFNDNDFNPDAGGAPSSIDTGDFVFMDDIDARGAAGSTLGNPFPGALEGDPMVVFNVGYADGQPNQGQFITFKVDTRNYTDLSLSFAHQSLNGNGFDFNTFSYSTDGLNFQDWGTFSPGADYDLFQADLTGITALNNNQNAAFRITFGGGAPDDGSAANALDNFLISGTALVTPEPSTWALMFLGMVVAMMMMRRKRDEEARVRVRADSGF